MDEPVDVIAGRSIGHVEGMDATGIDTDGWKLMPGGCSPSDPRVQPSKEQWVIALYTSPSWRDCQLWRKRVHAEDHAGIDLCSPVIGIGLALDGFGLSGSRRIDPIGQEHPLS